MMPKSPSISGASRSRKTSSTVNFMGGAVDDVSVQKTLAMALCSGLRCAKWGEVAFETNQDVLTAILLNVIRKDRGLGFSPLDFNNKEIVLMDLASEKLSMKTFKINVAYQTRESFLKEWKKFKSNSEFVLGKGTQLLYLKSVEGNILSCMTSGAATCPTFTVGNVDAGFYRLQLRGIVGIGDDKGAEVSYMSAPIKFVSHPSNFPFSSQSLPSWTAMGTRLTSTAAPWASMCLNRFKSTCCFLFPWR